MASSSAHKHLYPISCPTRTTSLNCLVAQKPCWQTLTRCLELTRHTDHNLRNQTLIRSSYCLFEKVISKDFWLNFLNFGTLSIFQLLKLAVVWLAPAVWTACLSLWAEDCIQLSSRLRQMELREFCWRLFCLMPWWNLPCVLLSRRKTDTVLPTWSQMCSRAQT